MYKKFLHLQLATKQNTIEKGILEKKRFEQIQLENEREREKKRYFYVKKFSLFKYNKKNNKKYFK